MTLDEELEKARRIAELEESIKNPPPRKNDGGLVDFLKDGPEFGKYLPGFLKEQGTNLARGAASVGEAALRLGENAPGIKLLQTAREAMGRPPTSTADSFSAAMKDVLPIDPNETSAQKLMRRLMQGAGAGAAAPVGGAGPVANTAAGVAGEMSGELLSRSARLIAPRADSAEATPLEKGADLAGSVLGGGFAGAVLGPRQSVGKADIRETLEGTSPKTFADASKNISLFSNVGAKTATLADAFPMDSNLRTLATDARNSNLTNALKVKTEGRSEELSELGKKFLDRVGPPVDRGQVANEVATAANNIFSSGKQTRSNTIVNDLMGEQIRPDLVRELYDTLITQSKRKDLTNAEAWPYAEIARRLLNQDGTVINETQRLSLAMKELRSAAKNPAGLTSSDGKTITAFNLEKALRDAESGLTEISKKYGPAMDNFKEGTRILRQAAEGPLGRLTDRNPNISTPTPAARMDTIVDSANSPQTVQDTIAALMNNRVTQGQPVDPARVARAISENRLFSGGTNPGQAVRGEAGSAKEANIAALLTAAGKNPRDTMAPLNAADLLQDFQGPAQQNRMPVMRAMQAVLRPFRTIDMMTTARTEASIQDEIATILADGSPEGLKKLQEIAMFDPNVRKILSARGFLGPLATQDQEN